MEHSNQPSSTHTHTHIHIPQILRARGHIVVVDAPGVIQDCFVDGEGVLASVVRVAVTNELDARRLPVDMGITTHLCRVVCVV